MRSLLEVESRDQVAWESRLVAWKGTEFLRKRLEMVERVGNGWDKVAMTIKVVDSCIIN